MSYEQIWAPWRLPYIVGTDKPPANDSAPGCFLCRYASAPEQDQENFVLHRGSHSITVLNRFPYNNGHLLVAPLSHKANLADLDDAEHLDCMHSLQKLVAALQATISPEGFNIGLNLGRVAGAGLPGHLHWHLVPRWNGDTNFMSVVADLRVIPQSLAALHALVKIHLEGADST